MSKMHPFVFNAVWHSRMHHNLSRYLGSNMDTHTHLSMERRQTKNKQGEYRNEKGGREFVNRGKMRLRRRRKQKKEECNEHLVCVGERNEGNMRKLQAQAQVVSQTQATQRQSIIRKLTGSHRLRRTSLVHIDITHKSETLALEVQKLGGTRVGENIRGPLRSGALNQRLFGVSSF